MLSMAVEKNKKTLYLPQWLISLLDAEGERIDGPGVVVGAAVFAFCEAAPEEKAKLLERFRQVEIQHAYQLKDDEPAPKDAGKSLRQAAARARQKKSGRAGRSAG